MGKLLFLKLVVLAHDLGDLGDECGLVFQEGGNSGALGVRSASLQRS